VKIKLNQKEKVMLHEILNTYHSDLHYKISDPDIIDFRNKYEIKEQFLKKISVVWSRMG